MATMKLIAPEGDIRAAKVSTVAAFAGVELERQVLVLGKDNLSAEFLEKSVMGRYPVLVTNQGSICESNAICRYIGKMGRTNTLVGGTPFTAAQVDMWMDFCTYELEIPVCCLAQQKAVDKAEVDVKTALKALNDRLLSHTYIVDDFITVADICLAVVVSYAQKCPNLGAQFLDSFINVNRWLSTIIQQTAYKEAQKLPAPSKVFSSEPKANGKNDEEEIWIDSGLFDIEMWKREYSNSKDFFQSAMKWFWGRFDRSQMSLWHMKYDKLEDECKVVYLTTNLLGGFLQATDESIRKGGFGVFHVIGEEGNLDIEGVWLFPSVEIPEAMKGHRSFEYHTFTKLTDCEKDKKVVEEHWCSREMVGGRPSVMCKVFK